MATVSFKVGDSFAMTGLALVGGVAQDMTGWTIKAQLRRASGAGPTDLISELDCEWVNASIASLLISDQITTDWPVCSAVMDIRLTSPTGDKTTSSTANFSLIGPVTRDE